MPQSFEAGFPPMILTDDYKIAFEARDADGVLVADVQVADPVFLAEKEGDIEIHEVFPLMFVPGPSPSGG